MTCKPFVITFVCDPFRSWHFYSIMAFLISNFDGFSGSGVIRWFQTAMIPTGGRVRATMRSYLGQDCFHALL